MFTHNLGQAPFDMLDHAGPSLPLIWECTMAYRIASWNSSNHPVLTPNNNVTVGMYCLH